MELNEKIIIASVMGAYLCFLIYQNRGYFTKQKHALDSEKSESDDETIYIIPEDGSKDYIEVTLPKDSNRVIMRYWRDSEQRFETRLISYDEFLEKWGDSKKESRTQDTH